MRFLLSVLCAIAAACLTRAQSVQPLTQVNVTSADGTIIYAESRGNTAGPHIIFAHGIACTALAWDSLWTQSYMQNHVFMVRFDARGHGRSGKPTDAASYQSARYAQDVLAVMHSLGATMPFFAGWSIGGAIAADLAAYWPTGIPFSGFIYISPLPWLPAPASILTPLGQAAPAMLANTDTVSAFNARINFASLFSVEGADVDFETMTSWSGGALYLMPSIVNLVFYRTQNIDPLMHYAKNGFPTLLLHGANDALIIPNATTALLQQNFTNLQEHTYTNAAHAVFYDRPNMVATDIVNFATANKASSPPNY